METSGNLGESEATQAIGNMEPPAGVEPATYWLRIVPWGILRRNQKEKTAEIYRNANKVFLHSTGRFGSFW